MAVNYAVVYSDPADADLERMSFQLAGRDPNYAVKWEAGPRQAVQELPGFPGPLSHTRDEEASAHYGREVRRMLYYGPARRRSGTPIRILFALLPPAPDDPPETAETVIFLLRLLHGSQSLLPNDPPQ